MAAKTGSQRREHFKTSSGIELPNDFNPTNTELPDYDEDIGAPGVFPFTRGIRHSMYRGRVWTKRHYAGYATLSSSQRDHRTFCGVRPAYTDRIGFG
jgi:methylmalonyl-CoA mutase N-terminal domain/subunit